MNRAEAIREIAARHPSAALVVANGLNSREAAEVADRPGNLYLLHGMGEALSVGLGLRSARPDLEVVVIDGDGNALMGAASWCNLPVEGLFYYVLENGAYETTGGQPVPPLSIEHPAVVRLPIERGTLGAPNPPAPRAIRERFTAWLAERSRTHA